MLVLLSVALLRVIVVFSSMVLPSLSLFCGSYVVHAIAIYCIYYVADSVNIVVVAVRVARAAAVVVGSSANVCGIIVFIYIRCFVHVSCTSVVIVNIVALF